MEWVETTGRSIEEAKEAALDRLGVDEAEAEFEVLEEPKAGLFGRLRREARVRARVKPTRPRAKEDRRDRRRRRGSNRGRGQTGRAAQGEAKDRAAVGRATSTATEVEATAGEAGGGSAVDVEDGGQGGDGSQPAGTTEKTSSARRRRRRRGGRGRGGQAQTSGNGSGQRSRSDGQDGQQRSEGTRSGGEGMGAEVSLDAQGEMVQEFLDGLLDAFELDGELRTEQIDDETIEVQILGDDLGLLIGPKGQTLAAVQELARTVVQRRAEGSPQGRFRVDVAGYRQRRREALERFARTVAEEVKATGVQKALEPMNPADRKVVHDTINEIDGVGTTSEGEEPRRRVVIVPAD